MKRWLAMLVAVALVSGCGGMKTKQRVSSLDETLNAYRILLRWGQYEDALRYIRFREPKPEDELPKLDLDALKPVKLASYDVVRKVMTPEEDKADIEVAITYYHEESNVLHSMRQTQHWWFDEESERWFLDGEFPDLIGNLRKDR